MTTREIRNLYFCTVRYTSWREDACNWIYELYSERGTAVAQWLRCCATNRKVAGSIPAGVSGFFIHTKSFRSHHGPGVDSASNRNEYQEYLLGSRRAVPKADNLPPSCAVVTKSGNFNFLESSGPVLLYLCPFFIFITACLMLLHVVLMVTIYKNISF